MTKVNLTSADGTDRIIEVPTGESLMRGAVNNLVSGIVGECGGQLMCATCHVYVDGEFLDALPPVSEDEDAMLDTTASPRLPNSRLSCQLVMNDELDGLHVTLPEGQI